MTGRWNLPADGAFALRANDGSASLQLHLESAKPFAIHGENGVSQKADGAGHASHYFSATRLATNGTLGLGGKSMQSVGRKLAGSRVGQQSTHRRTKSAGIGSACNSTMAPS